MATTKKAAQKKNGNKVKMTFQKETKGAVQYAEPGFVDKTGNYKFGSMYIRKSELPEQFPKEIEVTVSY